MTSTRMPARIGHLLEAAALPILLVLLVVLFTVLPETTQSFPTAANIQITLGAQSALIVIAMASLVPLICEQYDFSVGATAGLGAVYAASALSGGASLPVAILIAVAIGLVVGVINGVLVTRVGVNSVITTFGVATLIAGVVSWKTDGKAIVSGIPAELTSFLGGTVMGIPRSFLIALLVTTAIWYVLRQTPFGRYLAAIGDNPQAARLLGARVERRVLVSYLISGGLAGAAGILLIGASGTASPSVGPGYTLPAIAAAFLSVAAIQPGRFNVWGTLVAILFLGVLNSGLNLAGASPYVNDLANGAALILGVALASLLGRSREGRA